MRTPGFPFSMERNFMDISSTESPCQSLPEPAFSVISLPLFCIVTVASKRPELKSLLPALHEAFIDLGWELYCRKSNPFKASQLSRQERLKHSHCVQCFPASGAFGVESSRHRGWEVSSSGAIPPRPTLPLPRCVTLGVLQSLPVLNAVIRDTEMTASLRSIKASLSKYL